jgi:hypothetical protein
LRTHASDLPFSAVAALGFAVGVGFTLAHDPLPALRAGPLRELADDPAAVAVWFGVRTLVLLSVVLLVVAVAALPMQGRPVAPLVTAVLAAAPGGAIGAVVRLYLPRRPMRTRIRKAVSSHRSRPMSSRAARLGWIELMRAEAGLPVGVWAAACWAASLLIGFADVETRLAVFTDSTAAVLAFLATVLTLRFDAATVRLLTFDSTSFLRLAVDVVGVRLLVVLAAGAVVAVLSAPAALAGVALGAGLRALELLHGVRRSAPAARLLAQIETALVLIIGLVAGPAAGVWLLVRTAWLYRRADKRMGLA